VPGRCTGGGPALVAWAAGVIPNVEAEMDDATKMEIAREVRAQVRALRELIIADFQKALDDTRAGILAELRRMRDDSADRWKNGPDPNPDEEE
jgi:hypothetical protein